MPDISMCQAEDIEIENSYIKKLGTNMCPLREKCYRFKAKSSMYQSFSDFRGELNKDKTECNYFMKIWE